MTLHQLLPGGGFCFGCTWDLDKERVRSGRVTLTSLEPALHCFLKAQHTAQDFPGWDECRGSNNPQIETHLWTTPFNKPGR